MCQKLMMRNLRNTAYSGAERIVGRACCGAPCSELENVTNYDTSISEDSFTETQHRSFFVYSALFYTERDD